jgi:hypothetical protein
MVREIVGVAHRDLGAVKQILADAPQLANAAWDHGFGDWETPLGAAAHTGGREIAAELLARGARPDIFAAAMLGQLNVVKSMIAANPGMQSLRGPHGLSLLHHARVGDERARPVLEYLTQLGGADPVYEDIKLSEAELAAYVGEFSYGSKSDERLIVAPAKRMVQITVQRAGGSLRNLFHQGQHTFIPAGAHDARIAFTVENGRATGLVVELPKRVVTAMRMQ